MYAVAVLALLNEPPPRLVRDRAAPVRPSGEARIRLRLGGVCDTDLQLARGYMGHHGVLGHEFVGEVVESDDARWRGKRVVADINAGCGECADCIERDAHHCAKRTVLGILGRDGAFAEELTMPERCLVEVPDAVSDEKAVFAEPLAAALHVLDELDSTTDPVVVLGDGKLGQLVVRALRAAGVPTLLVGHHADKLALAEKTGARALHEADVDPARESAPVVIEATGSEAGLTLALRLTLPRGKLILKTTVAAELRVDLAPVVVNELQMVGSRCGDLSRAIRDLASGSVDPSPLIAARYPLAEAERAFEHAAQRGALKVLLEA
jgi:threonine dehydrogenase-like Zn-dependent dehydrogenase